MDYKLTILGTASALPIKDRFPSAQVLCVQGRLFLIDCAEGTQLQMRKAHLSFVRIEAIFISHIHGDHVFGLFGLLSTMAMLGRTGELHIYGPRALGGFVRFFLSYYGEGLNYEIIFHPVTGKSMEEVHVSKHVRVSAFPLNHKMECYGYRFDEIVAPRRPSNVPFVPRSYAYVSDTAPFEGLSEYVKGVNLLYHESTYPEEMKAKADMRFHSTARGAAETASAAGVGRLLVGHFSSKYPDLTIFAEEAREVFPNTDLAEELSTYNI